MIHATYYTSSFITWEAKWLSSLNWLAKHCLIILSSLSFNKFAIGFTLKTSSNSEMCAHNDKLKIYLNIFLCAICSVYISLLLILNAPAPYNSIGEHFLTINSHYRSMLYFFCIFYKFVYIFRILFTKCMKVFTCCVWVLNDLYNCTYEREILRFCFN